MKGFKRLDGTKKTILKSTNDYKVLNAPLLSIYLGKCLGAGEYSPIHHPFSYAHAAHTWPCHLYQLLSCILRVVILWLKQEGPSPLKGQFS